MQRGGGGAHDRECEQGSVFSQLPCGADAVTGPQCGDVTPANNPQQKEQAGHLQHPQEVWV